MRMRKTFFTVIAILLVGCINTQTEQPIQTQTLPIHSTSTSFLPARTGTLIPTITPDATATIASSNSITPTIKPAFSTEIYSFTTTPVSTIQPGQVAQLIYIDMNNDRAGWGIEVAGHILHSVDEGQTWKDATPPQGAYNSGGFFALDENQAWAISEIPGCYQEGCSSPPNFITIWRTEDGGENWLPSLPLCLVGDCGYDYDAVPEYLHTIAMQFLDKKTGWMLVTVQHVMIQDRWRVYMTVDGGKTWNFQSDNLSGPMVFFATGCIPGTSNWLV
jgi:hypothetical protein